MAAPVLYQDPFAPVLLTSTPLVVSLEQLVYVKKVLDRACSDSRFSDKAYVAIVGILTGAAVKVPTVSNLTPSSVVIGAPTFDLLVNGTNFTPESVIYFNGLAEPTTYVSATQVKTGVNMPLWVSPAVVPVTVLSSDGVLSNAMSFTFNAAALQAAKVEPKVTPLPPAKTEVKK